MSTMEDLAAEQRRLYLSEANPDKAHADYLRRQLDTIAEQNAELREAQSTEWEVAADNWKAIKAFCRQHPGETVKLLAVPADDSDDKAPAVDVPIGLHPRTADLVLRFASALAHKLHAAEQKYGYSDGWSQPEWMDECRAALVDHVRKGDPRDVAAFCAFLWHHGERTALPEPTPEDVRDAIHPLDALLPELCQLLDAFKREAENNGEGWTEWDESVRVRLRRVIADYNLSAMQQEQAK